MVQMTTGKKINLALQGGGAYGAFTWGVLDHIIEDGRLDIEGVTGAPAQSTPSCSPTALPEAAPMKPVNVLQTFGALQASVASYPSCSAK